MTTTTSKRVTVQHDPMSGLEASRKVGWAKYYKAVEEAGELRWLLRSMCERVLRDSRLRIDDDLVVFAEWILREMAS